MAAENILSTNITGLNAVPPTKLRGGYGSEDGLKSVYAGLTVTTGKDTGSTYRLVRLRSTAKVASIVLDNAALSASTAMDFGVYYSNAADGTTPVNVAGSATPVDQDFFASAVAMTNANRAVDITNESGTYTIDKRNQPLWQAVGLSVDPGGYLDIVATATASTAGTGLMGIAVQYQD